MTNLPLTVVFLVASVVALTLWRQTGAIEWAIASSGFAIAAIRGLLIMLKEVKRQ